MVQQPPGYLVVGNITKDLVSDGTFRLGGTASYSALTAVHLGVRTAVLTSCEDSLVPFEQPSSIQLSCVRSQWTTTFENLYEGWSRRQYIRAEATTLMPEHIPLGWHQAEIVHLGPIAHECHPSLAHAFTASLLGVTPQGWLRQWNGQGLVKPDPYACEPDLIRAADVVVLSMEDLGYNRQALSHYRQLARLLVLTLGPDGAIVYEQGRELHSPAFEVEQIDPTGAGDVFATAFMIRYHETGDAMASAQFANCVASFIIESVGTSNVPTRERVQERLAHGKLRS